MNEKLDLKKCIACWREIDDPMLSDLARAVEEEGKLPEEEEMIDLLTFYLVFAMGCREMKLEQEAENFNKRANWFLVGLQKANIKNGQYFNFVQSRNVDGLLNRIKNIASSRASYRMLDLERENKIVEGGK